MLDVFPNQIHREILISNPGLIYGAMLFRTFFWRLLWASYGMLFLDINWDVNWDANWNDNYDTNWDINWDANYHPK